MSEQVPLSEISALIAPKLVSCRNWGDASFISLPMVYPSGSFVTVRMTHISGGIRVSDSGFAYREAESFGAGRSFSKTARSVADATELQVGKRSIYVDVQNHEVERAIFDVSAASHSVAERIVSRASVFAEANISDALHEKLDHLFPATVEYESKVIGASSIEWEVSAVAKINGKSAVFQAVSNYPVAVYKASTAFHDISAREDPPNLISVVASKKEMGPNHSILAQAGRVIEISQSDEVYKRAVS